MRRTGFEPAQALSHKSLNLARLTTPASPQTRKESDGQTIFDHSGIPHIKIANKNFIRIAETINFQQPHKTY